VEEMLLAAAKARLINLRWLVLKNFDAALHIRR
jgi:hypothetical protein